MIRRTNTLPVVAAFFAIAVLCGGARYSLYAAALTRVSDLISTSAPSASATHTIQFIATQAIPVSGTISITPHPGQFTIPADFDFTDVDLAVLNGSTYDDRTLAAIASASEDGVAVTAGILGSITITLGSGVGIAAGERVQIELGSNATHGEIGDELIRNPSDQGSYKITLATMDASGNALDGAQAMVAVIQPVSVTSQNQNIPPDRLNGLPSGEIAAGNETVEISLETNEIATCRYATVPGIDFDSMPEAFTGVGGQFFYAVEDGFVNNTEYTFYVRCRDFYGVFNTDDYELTFSLAADPISNTSIVQQGSGGQGGVGLYPDGSSVLYLANVSLSGLTSPGSSVAILKDGVAYTTTSSDSVGKFSVAARGMERGSYTFVAYATDRAGRKSSLYSSTLSLAQGTNNTLSNIVISPTISLSKDTIEPGEGVSVSGESVSESTIQVILSRTGTGGAPKTFTTTTGADGSWKFDIESKELSRGTYRLYARSIVSAQLRSDESAMVSLGVGENASTEGNAAGATDINGDDKVNLVDFSIMLSSWGSGDTGSDFNGDGAVNLADFSILLFNWTG